MSDYKGMGAYLTQTNIDTDYEPPDIDDWEDIEFEDDDVETKDVRRVRTAAGVRRFKLPVGSPIVARPRTPKIGGGNLKAAAIWMQNVMPDFIVHPEKHAFKKFTHKGHNFFMVDDGMGKENALVFIQREGDPRGRIMPYVNHQNINGVAQVNWSRANFSTAERSKFWTAHLKQVALKNTFGRNVDNPPKIKKKRKSRAKDVWQGFYGFDWEYPDSDIDTSTDEGRRDAAIDLIRRVGGEVYILEGTHFSPEAVEGVGAVVGILDDLFPGFLEATGEGIYIDTHNFHGVFAYNAPEGYNPGGDNSRVRPVGRRAMFLPSEVWSEDAREITNEALAAKGFSSAKSGHFAVNVPRLAADLKIDVGTAMSMNVFTHEYGHSVQGMLSEQYGGEAAFFMAMRQFLINKGHRNLVEDIEMPVNSRMVIDDDYGTHSYSRARSEGGDLVSVYGVSSYSELVAEVWAAWVLNKDNTQVVEDLGDWLANEFKERVMGQ